ncbi:MULTISPECIES: SA0632 family lipoprotein [Mammaliicoccus]|uniref:SA0632 family lipoprotein n=1 Tax=Mammaliicoccus TaxID=2803850 RepID=UPI001883CD62|nr:DUF5068 domain-containing protein [Mammaliicoccus lentus]MBF0842038.1 DUF5068 domain-containing protein [Mammaliicoccus lentus]
MKKAFLLMVMTTVILAACGKDNEQEDLEKEIKSLEQSSSDYKKDKEKLKKENDKLKENIKEKEEKLKKIEDELGEKDNSSDNEQSDDESKDSKEDKAKQTSSKKSKNDEKMFPNTIRTSTNGDVELVNDLQDQNFHFEDSGMKVDVDHLQIFQVNNMPEGQVLLFNGAKDGYVIIYEVMTENTTEQKLYYDNAASIKNGDRNQRSDYASFIPDSHNEKYMKKSKENIDEYQPKEQTKSLKSIPISTEMYQSIKDKKATFDIQGGVSKTRSYDHASEKVKSFELNI